MDNLSFDLIYLIIGFVYVEGVEVGDVLKVKIYKIDLVDWGWIVILLGFGFLVDDFKEFYLWIFVLKEGMISVLFKGKINVLLWLFLGVMGVVLVIEEMFFMIFFRVNGGNMDDFNIVEGIMVYFFVFVEGGFFSIGDVYVV